jgi:hypothetical protein
VSVHSTSAHTANKARKIGRRKADTRPRSVHAWLGRVGWVGTGSTVSVHSTSAHTRQGRRILLIVNLFILILIIVYC